MQNTFKRGKALVAAIATVAIAAGLFWLVNSGFGKSVELYSQADSSFKSTLGLIVIGAAVIYGLYRVFLLFGQETPVTATED